MKYSLTLAALLALGVSAQMQQAAAPAQAPFAQAPSTQGQRTAYDPYAAYDMYDDDDYLAYDSYPQQHADGQLVALADGQVIGGIPAGQQVEVPSPLGAAPVGTFDHVPSNSPFFQDAISVHRDRIASGLVHPEGGEKSIFTPEILPSQEDVNGANTDGDTGFLRGPGGGGPLVPVFGSIPVGSPNFNPLTAPLANGDVRSGGVTFDSLVGSSTGSDSARPSVLYDTLRIPAEFAASSLNDSPVLPEQLLSESPDDTSSFYPVDPSSSASSVELPFPSPTSFSSLQNQNSPSASSGLSAYAPPGVSGVDDNLFDRIDLGFGTGPGSLYGNGNAYFQSLRRKTATATQPAVAVVPESAPSHTAAVVPVQPAAPVAPTSTPGAPGSYDAVPGSNPQMYHYTPEGSSPAGGAQGYAPVGTGTPAVGYAPVGTGTAVGYAPVGTGSAHGPSSGKNVTTGGTVPTQYEAAGSRVSVAGLGAAVAAVAMGALML